MIRVALGLAASCLVLAPAARADEFPVRKPGLWEITMTLRNAPPRVSRLCIDAATEARMRTLGQTDATGLCSRRNVSRSGDIVTIDSVCRIGSSEVTTHAVTTITGDTAYRTESASHFDPPTHGGMVDSNMTQDAKWLGPCGPDMQPGDMMIGGHKMHMP